MTEPKKAEIKITVGGHAGVGKTTVAMIVQAALDQCGIETQLFDLEEQHPNFTDAAMVSERMDAIAKKTKVRIEVAQLKRASMND